MPDGLRAARTPSSDPTSAGNTAAADRSQSHLEQADLRHTKARTNAKQRRLHALVKVAYTAVDFGAALCFIIGSLFFFRESLKLAGTWLFLVDSVLFAAKPAIRLFRELKLLRMREYDDLAQHRR